MEIWKDIEGFEGLYKVSNLGEIKSVTRTVNSCYNSSMIVKGKLRIQSLKAGYKYVDLSKDGKTKSLRVNRIVAIAFIPNPENKPYVNHINGIKSDNRVENLEWNTASENDNHAFTNNLRKSPLFWAGKSGSDHNKSKKVNMLSINGEFIKSFGSIREAERITGVQSVNISKCCSKKRITSGGYKWEYST